MSNSSEKIGVEDTGTPTKQEVKGDDDEATVIGTAEESVTLNSTKNEPSATEVNMGAGTSANAEDKMVTQNPESEPPKPVVNKPVVNKPAEKKKDDAVTPRVTRAHARRMITACKDAKRRLDASVLYLDDMLQSDEIKVLNSAVQHVRERKRCLLQVIQDMKGVVLDAEYSKAERQLEEANNDLLRILMSAEQRIKELEEKYEAASHHSKSSVKTSASAQSKRYKVKATRTDISKHSVHIKRTSNAGSVRSRSTHSSTSSYERKKVELKQDMAALETSIKYEHQERALRDQERTLRDQERTLRDQERTLRDQEYALKCDEENLRRRREYDQKKAMLSVIEEAINPFTARNDEVCLNSLTDAKQISANNQIMQPLEQKNAPTASNTVPKNISVCGAPGQCDAIDVNFAEFESNPNQLRNSLNEIHGVSEDLPPIAPDPVSQDLILFDDAKALVSPNVNDPSVNEIPQIAPSQARPNMFSNYVISSENNYDQLTVFSGDAQDFQLWDMTFTEVVDTSHTSCVKRMNLLRKYVSSEALEMIKGYMARPTESGYAKARAQLRSRFGDDSLISSSILERIDSWPKIRNYDYLSLLSYSDFLNQIVETKRVTSGLEQLSNPDGGKRVARALPSPVINEWCKEVSKWKARVAKGSNPQRADKPKTVFPDFEYFAKFVKKWADSVNVPELRGIYELSKPNRDQTSAKSKGNYAQSKSTEKSAVAFGTNTADIVCLYCKGNHHINECEAILDINDHEQKRKIYWDNYLCYGCGKKSARDHLAKTCKDRAKCKICEKRHPTCFHIKAPEKPAETQALCTEICVASGSSLEMEHSMIVPVRVRSKMNPEREHLCYCVLDNQADACFISDDIAEKLNLIGKDTRLKLNTMSKENEVIDSKKYFDLEVFSYDKSDFVNIPVAYSRSKISAKHSQIPKIDVCKKWKHLEGVAENLVPYDPSLNIDMLIGFNVPKALQPVEIVPGEENDPYGQKTALGWAVIGVLCRDTKANRGGVTVNRCNVDEVMAEFREPNNVFCESFLLNDPQLENELENATGTGYVKYNQDGPEIKFVHANSAKEVINFGRVCNILESDFVEQESNITQKMSALDRKFVRLMSQSISKCDDGHYEMCLPLKHDVVMLPDNKPLALKRFNTLLKRLEKNENFKKEFVKNMSDMIESFAEPVPESELNLKNGMVNYIPYLAVVSEKKPGKVRIVFDCSAKYGGVSLNDYLIPGPDMLNSALGVMLRFRKEQIAIKLDIRAFFHQFRVSKPYRNLLRFLWVENGDVNGKIVEYRMKVHLFGSVSSGNVASYGLKYAAQAGEIEFGKDVADFIRNEFYVDDGIASCSSVSAVVSLVKGAAALCSQAGLVLCKAVSNSREVLHQLPSEMKAPVLQNFDCCSDPLPIEKTLGIEWDVETDALWYKVDLKSCPVTRRGILSCVSGVYDPLGIIAPCMLEAKLILQSMCKTGINWDDPIPETIKERFIKWKSDIVKIRDLKIERCYKPKNFGTIVSIELHHFADACETGYGQCSYIRYINSNDKSHCAFVIGKSRVAPLKQVSVPRLELTAAVVAARMSTFIKSELKIPDVKEFFWSDSMVVLGYIKNESKRFGTYVANRVQAIQDLTNPEAWYHVSGKCNPSDDSSRGLSVEKLTPKCRWLRGPDFLWQDGAFVPSEAPLDIDQESLEKIESEMRSRTAHCIGVVDVKLPKLIFDISGLERISSWIRAKRVIASCVPYRVRMRFRNNTDVTVDNLANAEKLILRALQQVSFPEEFKVFPQIGDNGFSPKNRNELKMNKLVRKKCSLSRLDPFKDNDGILRVGGRIVRSGEDFNVRHPIILPKKSHVTSLIVRHYHGRVNHMGRYSTLNAIRQAGFWIVQGTSAVSREIHRCVICKKLRANAEIQKMADLPRVRCEVEPPFTYCGCDVFGWFNVKQRRAIVKRWVVIITCLSSRAIHLESVESMTTDSFINALRRVIARRGPIRQIRCDQGSNFVGANNELLRALQEMDCTKVKEFLAGENCDWIEFKFGIPSASHMQGYVERQIRTVRSVLQPLLWNFEHLLCDESFRTFLAEAEAIVNSRPLTVNSICDSDAPESLTPNHILTMKSQVVLPPPGKFLDCDKYLAKRWRRVQYLANEFWFRWRKEFLQSLQQRVKWNYPKRNVRTGDIVIIKDENQPRNAWPLGRVVSTSFSDDGLVRKVRLAVGTKDLDDKGKRVSKRVYLDRPVHKLVLLLPSE